MEAPATSSVPRTAPRPSKCAHAYMVAFASVECPKPMAWPISWVRVSAALVAPKHVPRPLFMVTSPSMTRWTVRPFTTMVSPELQMPPMASTPEQFVKSWTSL